VNGILNEITRRIAAARLRAMSVNVKFLLWDYAAAIRFARPICSSRLVLFGVSSSGSAARWIDLLSSKRFNLDFEPLGFFSAIPAWTFL